jgi:hypothetical protein
VVSVADHTGWAHVVCVTLRDQVPVVVDRRRMPLIDEGLPTMPYHHETVGMGETEANALIARVRRSVEARTARELSRLVHELAPHGRVMALAVREPPYFSLPASVADVWKSYALQNAADGVMYQQALCGAARGLGLDVQTLRRKDEVPRAAARLGVTVQAIDGFVSRTGRPEGPPWTQEHRRAFAAGLAALASYVRAGEVTLR